MNGRRYACVCEHKRKFTCIPFLQHHNRWDRSMNGYNFTPEPTHEMRQPSEGIATEKTAQLFIKCQPHLYVWNYEMCAVHSAATCPYRKKVTHVSNLDDACATACVHLHL